MTPAPKRRYLLILFAITLACGIFQGLVGVALDPSVRVEFQLDAVLNSEEWHDLPTRERTRELLLRSDGNEHYFWFATGLVVSSASAAGLWLLRNPACTR